ncbi:MAG: RDD family protein [Bacteroidetes bacterium]|nr:RDD family protein [Bacteroidota bacterium]
MKTSQILSYPAIIDRIKAAFFDSLFLVLVIYILSLTTQNIQIESNAFRIIGIGFILLMYDPLFTHFSGGTIGHHFTGIRVKQEKNPNLNITLPKAILRFILKASLGWISLLTVSGDSAKRAIHDKAIGSVVVRA